MADADFEDDVVVVLENALALMNDNGKHWTKGSYNTLTHDRGEVFCSVGAIWRASRQQADKKYGEMPSGGSAKLETRNAYYGRLVRLAVRSVAEAYGAKSKWMVPGAYEQVVVQWNDRSDTTWDKVVKRFTRAKSRARAVVNDTK